MSEQIENQLNDFFIGKKKKRTNKKVDNNDNNVNNEGEQLRHDNGCYDYDFLLKRAHDMMPNNDSKVKAINIDNPIVAKLGTKRIIWLNFGDNCKSINRSVDHVLSFVLVELQTTGAIGENNKLTIRGRYDSKKLESILTKYISEYVSCKTCKSLSTELEKRNRILFKVCKTCGSHCSVSSL